MNCLARRIMRMRNRFSADLLTSRSSFKKMSGESAKTVSASTVAEQENSIPTCEGCPDISSRLKAHQQSIKLNQLVQEIQQCKANHEAVRERINHGRVVLDERNQLLNVLQKNLDDIRSENEKLATLLRHGSGS